MGEIWQEYQEGHLTIQEAAERSSYIAQSSIQIVDSSAARSVRDVLPDVIENEAAIVSEQSVTAEDQFQALPAIARTDTTCEAKLLTIGDSEEPLKGYRCFLALSDKVREEKGEFFLQPHKTSVVWGGQRVLFIFQHHSTRFGLYYDLQTADVVSSPPGGGPFMTCTIVLQNRILIPIPPEIQIDFAPSPGEKKRFEVRCELLYTDSVDFEE
jgi:molecular chaperone HtpG